MPKSNTEDSAIVRAIISIAHTLKMGVIAEGVETEEQLNYLKQLKCDAIQGYWLSRPLPVNALEDWLKAYLLRPG